MKKIILLLLLMLSCFVLWASLEQSLAGADSLNIGSRFDFILKADSNLRQAIVPDTLSVFEVLSQEVVKDPSAPDYLKLNIMPMRIGALSFPELVIVDEEGNEFRSDRFRVHVLSVRAEGDTLLRDIKSPRRYPWEIDFRLFLLLCALAAIILIWLLIRLLRKSKTKPEVSKPMEILPNWKLALQELKELIDGDLLSSGQVIAFHYALSMILRRFLEAEYHFHAVEMTTFEIREHLHSARESISSTQNSAFDTNAILGFLRSCDRVKYAKHLPEMQDIQSRIDWLRDYLMVFSKVVPTTPISPSGSGGKA